MRGEIPTFLYCEYTEYFRDSNGKIDRVVREVDEKISRTFRGTPIGDHIWIVRKAVTVQRFSNLDYQLKLASPYGDSALFELREELPLLVAKTLGLPYRGESLRDFTIKELGPRLPKEAMAFLESAYRW